MHPAARAAIYRGLYPRYQIAPPMMPIGNRYVDVINRSSSLSRAGRGGSAGVAAGGSIADLKRDIIVIVIFPLIVRD